MRDELREIDQEWNQLAANLEDDMEIEFLEEDDLLEFVHDSEF